MGKHGGKSPAESFATGLFLAGAFICLWAFGGHQTWALFAAVFAGILPASRGLSGLIEGRRQSRAALGEGERKAPKRLDARDEAARKEKAILRAARDRGGRVTPSLIALESDLSVEEAERALDELAKKGHASMRVREDGRIEYEFSEFLPVDDPS